MKHFNYEWLRTKIRKGYHCLTWAITLGLIVGVTPIMGQTPNAPDSLEAIPGSETSTALTVKTNTANDSVVVIYNQNNNFTTPTDGSSPGMSGSSFAGGTVAFKGLSNSFELQNLNSGTKYYFQAYSYNSGYNYSDSLTSQSFTAFPLTYDNYQSGFNTNPASNGWTQFSNVGSQVWNFQSPDMVMNAYSGGPNPNLDWLVSPAFELNNYGNEVLQFDVAEGFSGTDLEVLYSTDYQAGTNPANANWSAIDTLNGTATVNDTMLRNIGNSSGQLVYVAFRYDENPTSKWSNGVSEWTLGSFKLSGASNVENPAYLEATTQSETSIQITDTSNQANDSLVVVYNQTGNFASFTSLSGEQPGTQGSNFAGGTIAFKGKTTAKNITGLTPGTQYYFKAYAYTNAYQYSTGSNTKAATAFPLNYTSFQSGFSSNPLNEGWTTYDVTGNQAWSYNSSNNSMIMSAYSGSPQNNEDWLFSPAFVLDRYSQEMLKADLAKSFSGTSLEVLVSSDYEAGKNPNQYNWTAIDTFSSNGSLTDTTVRNIGNNQGQLVHVGFKYDEDPTSKWGSSVATWDLTSFSLTGSSGVNDPSYLQAITQGENTIQVVDSTNANGDSVVIVYNQSGNFAASSTLSGQKPGDSGTTFANGTIAFKGKSNNTNLSGLSAGTKYHVQAYSYDASYFYSSGISKSAFTAFPLDYSTYSNGFSNNPLNNGWSSYSDTGAQQWVLNNNQMEMNAYAGGSQANEDWLITPAFNLNNYNGETVDLDVTENFDGTKLEVLYSTDYVNGQNPDQFTWTPLDTIGSNATKTYTKLKNVSGQTVYIAFRYDEDPTTKWDGSGDVSTWLINNFDFRSLSPCQAPTAQPSNLQLTPFRGNSIDGVFNPASPSADGYLVVRSTNPSLSAQPSDSLDYNNGDQLGNGTVVRSTTDTSFRAGPLTSGTEYHFFVFAYNNLACLGGPDYRTMNPLTGSDTTQATLYTEFFNGKNGKGITGNLSGGPTIDTAGITNWFIEPVNNGFTDTADWFKVVNGKFQARDVDSMQVWKSKIIDINGFNNVSVELEASETGNLEADDSIATYYRLNQNTTNQLGSANADFSTVDFSKNGLNGSSLQVIAKAITDEGSEIINFDEVRVYGTPAGLPNLPNSLTVNTQGETSAELNFQTNSNNDSLVIVSNTNGQFSKPTSAPSGNLAGGTVIYAGQGNTFTHSGLAAGTKYYYKAFSYASGQYSATGRLDSTYTAFPVMYTEDFTSNPTDQEWVAYSEIGNEAWNYESGDQAMQMNAFNNGVNNNIDWLISPAFELSKYDDEELEVRLKEDFAYTKLEILYSTDYQYGKNPANFTWTPFDTFDVKPGSGSFNQQSATVIPDTALRTLNNAGVTYVAFRYDENPTSKWGSSASEWQVADFKLYEKMGPDQPNGLTTTTKSETSFELNVQSNGSNDSVVVIYAPDSVGTPSGNGPLPAEGSSFANGTVAFTGISGTKTVTGLQAGEGYILKAYAFDGSIYSEDAIQTTGFTAFPLNYNGFANSFAGNPLDSGWTQYSNIGFQNWNYNAGAGAIQMNAYSGGAQTNLDWLISPAFELNKYNSEALSLQLGKNFSGTNLELLYSTDYENNKDPQNYTWTVFDTLTNGGTVERSALENVGNTPGTLTYVAFRYDEDPTSKWGSSAAEWQLQGFALNEVTGLKAPDSLTASPAGENAIDLFVSSNSNNDSVVVIYSTDTLAQPSGNVPAEGSTFSGGTVAYKGLSGNKQLTGLMPGTQYHFKAYAFNDSTFSPQPLSAKSFTGFELDYTRFDNGFDVNPVDSGWTQYSVVGSEKWTYDSSIQNIGMNAYNNGAQANEDWLISPAFSLNNYSSEQLVVDLYENFNGTDLEVLYSTDYQAGQDPTNYTWNAIDTLSAPGFNNNITFTDTMLRNVGNTAGTQSYVAFRYDEAPTTKWDNSGDVGTWNVNSFKLIELIGPNKPTKLATAAKGSRTLNLNINTNSQNDTVVVIYSQDSIGKPSGTAPSEGSTFANGTVAYKGLNGSKMLTGLNSGTQYNFEAYSYDGNLYSTNAITKAQMTAIQPDYQTFASAFSVNPFDSGWSQYSVSGSGQTWSYNSNNQSVSMNAYSGGCQTNEDWLITPAFDLTQVQNEELFFQLTENFNGTTLEVLYAENYQQGMNPNSATWTTIDSFTTSATLSGDTSLRATTDSTVHVAYKYVFNSGSCSGFELTNFELLNVPGPAQPNSLIASPESKNSINLTYSTNNNGDNIVLVYDNDSTFTKPNGAPPSTGSSFAGGTLIHNGSSGNQTLNGLQAGTKYYFQAYAYDGANYSSIPLAQAAFTAFTLDYDVYSNGFNNNPLDNGWTKYSVAGQSQTWSYESGNQSVRMNAFSGGCQTNEDWLISPAFDLTQPQNENLSFSLNESFDGTTIQALYAENYQVGTDPNSVSWTVIDSFKNSATVNGDTILQALSNSSVHVAFKYVYSSGSCSQFDISAFDLINVQGPNKPTNLVATPASESSLDVSYTTNDSADNVVVVYDTDGSFTKPNGAPPAQGNSFAGGTLLHNGGSGSKTLTNLQAGKQYFFKAYSYDGNAYSSQAIAQSRFTAFPLAYDAFKDGFSTNPLDSGWTQYSNVGQGQVWNYFGTQMQMNAFSGGAQNNVDWLITPGFQLGNYVSESINFTVTEDFSFTELEVLYATNYETNEDPMTYNWTAIDTLDVKSGSSPFSPVTDSFKLDDLQGVGQPGEVVHIAFRYDEAPTSKWGSGVSTWQIDQFELEGQQPCTWTGAQNSQWNNANNWTGCQTGGVPGPNDAVVIPSNTPNNPTVGNNNLAVKDLIIRNGSQLNFAGKYTLEINGQWQDQTNNGVTLSNGKIEFGGSAMQKIQGSQTLFNTLAIDNGSGVTANDQSALEVDSALKLVNGTFTVNGSLTLNATSQGVAYLDDFSSGMNGTYNGEITVEQVATGSAGWRYVSSPVSNAEAGEMHDDFFISTGQTGNTYYYEETNSGSGFLDGWTPISSRSENMDIMQGFDIYFWQQSNANARVSYPETFDISGSPTTGSQSRTLTASGSQWNLVGNPYPSKLNWDQVNLPNNNSIFDGIYIWNPANGQFETYVNGMGTNGGDAMIAPMQAFFVWANSGPTTLTLNNNARSAGQEEFVGKRSKDTNPRITLKVSDKEGASDEMIVYFDQAATEGFDGSYDAYEFKSKQDHMPNIYSKINEENASINGLPKIHKDLTIPVQFESGKASTYTIDGSFQNITADVEVYLEDLATGQVYDLQNEAVEVESSKATRSYILKFAKDEATSTSSENVANEVKVFQDQSELKIDFGSRDQGKAEVKVFSINGSTLQSSHEVPANGIQSIDLNQVSKGIYLVQITNENTIKREKVFIH